MYKNVQSLLKQFPPSNQIVNLQMLYHQYLKSICESVESEADPQFGQCINFASVKIFPGYATDRDCLKKQQNKKGSLKKVILFWLNLLYLGSYMAINS